LWRYTISCEHLCHNVYGFSCCDRFHLKNLRPFAVCIHHNETFGSWTDLWCQYGVSGHSHGCNGASVGTCCVIWHPVQLFTKFSISWSIPGHHTWLLASAFIFTTPGWLLCNNSRIWVLNFTGIIIYSPH
jgi:hypothetical protein